jgi:hypothetical protein
MSSLRGFDLNAWTQKIVVKDASGAVVLSTMSLGILSLDLFLNTLSLVLDESRHAATAA